MPTFRSVFNLDRYFCFLFKHWFHVSVICLQTATGSNMGPYHSSHYFQYSVVSEIPQVKHDRLLPCLSLSYFFLTDMRFKQLIKRQRFLSFNIKKLSCILAFAFPVTKWLFDVKKVLRTNSWILVTEIAKCSFQVHFCSNLCLCSHLPFTMVILTMWLEPRRSHGESQTMCPCLINFIYNLANFHISVSIFLVALQVWV